jgi:hypothetical protein
MIFAPFPYWFRVVVEKHVLSCCFVGRSVFMYAGAAIAAIEAHSATAVRVRG